MDEYGDDMLDSNLDAYETYEEYLDDQMVPQDLFYLEDRDLARQLIEVGYHGKSEVLTPEQFSQRKQAQYEARKNQNAAQVKALTHESCPIEGKPFLMALAQREEALRNGRLTTILFIRDQKNKGEVSGYIDLADRMRTQDFKHIFMKKKLLQPQASDLSYYNWEGQSCSINDSPNFRVDANSDAGLLFRNKRDRKVIYVNPDLESPGDGTTRSEIECDEYTQVVFFDHTTRRKH